ncbi:hypothetical protein MQE23_08750 [Streptomyces sp. HP-A2021]|uniref:hypothetical protein n=1 Tax=Streptomyces sp. HP-A2021 TaxID=2927875 RepID=UPI001FB00CE9|nr:hypothetical protein [Streptomyces sp. HP-A2021]UOB09140.1 hypothetical protein MQE23_08750 [Streptomyces sp. HP-A2021]
MMHVLWGWCTLHAVIYLGLAFAALWIAQFVTQVVTERKPQPCVEPADEPRVPLWARNGHLPPSPRPQGRHRKTGSTR